MIRLLELSIQNFRGFGPTHDSIKLDADLTLIFGPNGYGKTSLAEAIEWLFYGATKRRQHGELFSKAEYTGCYANVHGRQPTQVEAHVNLDGQEIKLVRRMHAADQSITLIDGVEANFSSIGFYAREAVYPIVAQHSLQSFIHSKPKDRRDAICAALGLDELTTFKTTLDSARTSFQRSPPSSVVEARKELATLAPELAKIATTETLARRWAKTPMEVGDFDLDLLMKSAAAITNQECNNAETALMALREARKRASQAVFDADPLYPSEELSLTIAAFHEKEGAAATAATAVERAVAAVSAAMTSTYSALLLGFWKTGLELAPEGVICPMCEADTLVSSQREELRRRLTAGELVLKSTAALTTALQSAKRAIQDVSVGCQSLGIVGINDPAKSRLVELFATAPESVDAFLGKYDTWIAARLGMTKAQTALTDFFANCAEEIKIPEMVPRVLEQAVKLADAYISATAALITPFLDYVEEWRKFKEILLEKIASTDLVSSIDAVGKAIKQNGRVELLLKYNDYLNETQVLIRAAESKILKKQRELLKTRGKEVEDNYKLLSGNAEVGFSEMEPGTDSIKLHANSYGRRMHAAANLSECQLNCLGLAVWLMRATTPSSPFGFILLDDPVQSMDDVHHEAFIASVIPNLLDDHNKQVIILSHTKSLTKRIQDLNSERHVRSYHLENYDRDGPTVTEQIGLAMLLADIKAGAKGGERHRAHAVDRIRVLSEHFIRELHIKKLGVPAPSTFNRAQAKELLPLFCSLPDTTPQEHAGLKDTIRFSDPEHHTEVGYTTPVRSNIDPHISRLEQLMKKYGLI